MEGRRIRNRLKFITLRNLYMNARREGARAPSRVHDNKETSEAIIKRRRNLMVVFKRRKCALIYKSEITILAALNIQTLQRKRRAG